MPAIDAHRIFLSAVTAEFGRYRIELARRFEHVSVKGVFQEEFEYSDVDLIEKLYQLIKPCDVVIHFVGAGAGANANPAAVKDFLSRCNERKEDFLGFWQKGHGLSREFFDDLTYTQWEAVLAIYLGKHFMPMQPEGLVTDGHPEKKPLFAATPADAASQDHHSTWLSRTIRKKPQLFEERDGSHIEDAYSKIVGFLLRLGSDWAQTAELLKANSQGISTTRRPILILGALTMMTTGAFFLRPRKETSSLLPELTKTLKIVAVMGENVDYEKAILKGFQDAIGKETAPFGYKVEMHVEDPRFAPDAYASPSEPKAKPVWESLVQRITDKYQAVDFYVTLGTYATNALKTSGLLEQLGTTGLVYLGVTDPYHAKIAGTPKIAGVQYGPGPTDYGMTLDRFFRSDQRLVFLSNEGIPQDEAIKNAMLTLNETFMDNRSEVRRNPRFEMDIRPHENKIGIEDIERPIIGDVPNSAVYYAWYGLDNLLSKTENYGVIRREKVWVVPSTYSRENLKYAGVVISVSDEEVGELGASIIGEKLKTPNLALNQMPVEAPPFKVWVNRSTIAANGLEKAIKPEFLRNEAAEQYPSWLVLEE